MNINDFHIILSEIFFLLRRNKRHYPGLGELVRTFYPPTVDLQNIQVAASSFRKQSLQYLDKAAHEFKACLT